MRSLSREMEHSSRPFRSGLTVVEVLVVLAIITLLTILLLPAIQPGNGVPRGPCKQCCYHFRAIGLALHNYHETYGSFPPPFTVDTHGNKLHSWRTLLLPYIDQVPLYKSIDLSKPWNDPANAAATKTVVACYRCPLASGDETRTTYCAVLSPGGLFPPGGSTTLKQISDGSANTLAVLEVGANRAVHWMSPSDIGEASYYGLPNDTKPPHPEGFPVLFADGRALVMTAQELRMHASVWLTIAGGEVAP